jgi:adenylosuccinate synthase
MRLVTLAIVVAAVLFGVEAAAVQEQQLPYSGVALTPSGAPVADGLHQMEFRLYTGATASEPVWTELQLVQTRSGSYQVVLGQSRPLPLTTGQQYWLEVLCDGASLGRMPLALLPSQAETKVAARSLQELHLNPVQSAAPDGWVQAGLPTLGGATPPQPLVVNTCEECTTTFWALTGNAGTNPNNNFLGTTDNQPLIIRTNNVNRVRITTGGQIEVLNSARSVSLGEGAGIRQNLTAFRNNVFVGYQAGSATETGIQNVAVGSGALSQNIGGSSNTALGSNAMSELIQGDYNTAIGYGAQVEDGLTNATAIGAFARAERNNTVVIGSIQGVNGATATANVGIGTTTPMNRLHVVSTADPLRLEGLLVNSALDNVLVVDASGVVKKRSLSGFVDSTAWLLTGNTLSGGEVLGSLNPQPLVLVTNNVERLRVEGTGEVVVQNQAAGTPTTVLRVLGGNGGAGATQVVIQAGANQAGVNLLEWRDNLGSILGVIGAGGLVGIGTATPGARLDVVNPTGGGVLRLQAVAGQTGALLEWVNDLGDTLGVIDNSGLVGIGTAAPMQKLHVVGNGTVSAVFVEGGVGVGTVNPLATLHVYDEGTSTPGATKVIIQAGANQGGEKLLEWRDNSGTVELGGIDAAGNLFVNTNTTLGDAAGDTVRVNARTVELPNIPSGSTATDVLVRTGTGNVEHRSASGLIGGFAWMLTGNSITSAWNGSSGNFLGTTNARPLVIATTDTTTPQPIQFWTRNVERVRITEAGDVGIGTRTPGARLHVVGTGRFDGQLTVTAGGAAITGNSTVTGTLTVSSDVSVGGNLAVAGNTTLGDAAGDTVRVNARTVELPNIPSGSTATEVLVRTGTGNVEHRSASGLIGGFAWMLTGNSITSAWNGSSGNFLGTTNARPLVIATTDTTTPQPIQFWTRNVERVRITEAGDVGIGTRTPGARLHVVGTGRFDGQLTVTAGGAAITGNSTVTGTLTVSSDVSVGGNLAVAGNTTLGDAAGDTVRVNARTVELPNIPSGSTATEVLVRTGTGNVEHRSASGLIGGFAWMLTGNSITSAWNGSSGNFLGTTNARPLVIATTDTTTPQPIQFWTRNVERVRITEAGDVGIGTRTPGARLHVVGTGRFDGQLTVTAGGAAITGNSTVTGTLTVSSDVSVGGNLAVAGNTTLGDAAGDTVRVNARTVELPNIPSGSTATEVLVRTGTGNVEHRSASGLIGGFAWMLTGNSITSAWNGSSGNFLGTTNARPLVIATTDTTTPQPIQFWTRNVERVRITEAGDVGIGTRTPGARLHVVGTGRFDGQLTVTAGGAAITGNSTVTGTLTVSSDVSVGGNLAVAGNTTLGDAAGDTVRVNARTVELPNIPSGSTATEVLVRTGTGNVEHRSASGLIGGFAWMLTGNSGTNPAVNFLGTTDAQPLVIRTDNTERVRVTATGDVVLQNQAAGTPTTVLRVLGGNGGAGATQVVIQAGANQAGVNLLEWRDNLGSILGVIGAGGLVGIGTATPGARLDVVNPTGGGVLRLQAVAGQTGALLEWVNDLGDTLGVIDNSGLVGIGTAAPMQKLHVVGNGTVSAVFVEGGVGVGTVNPLATLHVYDEGTSTPGATKVIIQAGANQGGEKLLEWRDNSGTVELGGIDAAGNLFVNTNTTLGDAAGDTVRVNARTVELPNIPSGSTATDVLVRTGTGNVEHRSASGLIGGFAWMLTGNSITSAWNGSSGNFLGTTNARPLVIATTDTTTPQPIQFWTRNVERVRITEAGDVGIGTRTPGARLHVVGTGRFDGQLTVTAGGAAITGNSTVTGTLTVSSDVSVGGNLAVAGNTTLGDAAGDTVRVNARTVELPNIPSGSTATEVLVRTGTGNVEHRSASGLIGGLAWALTGNSGTNPAVNFLGTTDAQPLVIRTDNTERVRVTATGDVVLQNQAAGTPTTVLRVLGGNGGTGATQVVLQAGANQSGVDLLRWQNNSGDTLGVIRPEGSVVLVYDPPARQAFFAVANPSGVPLIGIGPDPSGWGVGVYEPIAPFGQLRAGMGRVGTEWRMGVGDLAAQNGVLLNWATTGTVNEPRIVVANGSLATPVFLVDREGDVTVAGNTTLGDAAGDTVRVNARTVELPNIPSGSTATEVLVRTGTGNVEHRSASGLIGGFAWMLTGNSITSAWNGSSGNFLGTTNARPLVIATTDTTTPQPIQFWTRNVERVRITEAGDVGIGTRTPGARLHVVGTGRFDGQLTVTAGGAAITGNSTVTGTLTVSSDVSVGGNLAVAGNTTLGDAAGDTVRVNARTVELPNIPSGSTATEVLVRTGTGNVEHRSASGLIGGFAWMLTGNSITSAWNGSSGNFLGTTNARPLVIATTDTTTPQPIQFWTRNVERVRITEAGDVGIGTRTPGARLHVVGTGRFDGQLTVTAGGAAITGNSTVTGTLTVSSDVSVGGNLAVAGNTTLGDAAGDTVRVNARTVELPNIPSGSTATEVLVRTGTGNVEHRSASGLIGGFAWMLTGNSITSAWNGSSGNFLGTTNARPLVIATTDTTTPQPIQFWTRNVERVRITEAGDVGIGTRTPGARLHVVGTGRFDGQLTVTAGGAAITGNSTVTGTLTVSSDVSVGGNLAVAGNTTLGDAAGDTVRVNARTVELPNIPSGSTATEVLVRTGTGNVEHRSASGLIGGFAWMLTGNSITSAWNGSSGNFLGTTNARPLVIATTDTTTPQPIQFWTRNVERVRITEAGDVGIGTRTSGGVAACCGDGAL